jgi:hypothetical protein
MTGQPWTLNQFVKGMNNDDSDYIIIALNEFVQHLSSITILELNPFQINDYLLNEIISKMINKTPEIVNPTFRAIVLLSKVLPLSSVPNLFNGILDAVYGNALEIQTQILSVLREIMALAVQFDPDRQLAIVNTLAPRMDREIKQSANVDSLLFSIDLLSHVEEFLGFRFVESQKTQVLETIKTQLRPKYTDAIPSVAALTRTWAQEAPLEMLNTLLTHLFDLDDQLTAIIVLCSMVRHKPALYEKYAACLLELFIVRIAQEEADLATFMKRNQRLTFTQQHNIYNIRQV